MGMVQGMDQDTVDDLHTDHLTLMISKKITMFLLTTMIIHPFQAEDMLQAVVLPPLLPTTLMKVRI